MTDFEPQPLDMGWFSLCFDVEDMEKAVEFYNKLGFRIVSGGVDKGYCAISNGNMRFSLFPNNFIKQEFGVSHLFNFRGGRVKEIVETLKSRGVEFTKDYTVWEEEGPSQGSEDAIFSDTDGNVIYVDTHPTERDNDPRGTEDY